MADSSSGIVVERKKRSWLAGFFVRLVKEKPLGTVGLVIILLLLFTGIFADFLAPYGMDEPNVADRLLAPSAKFWLGTDNLGRDLLSRIIFGARTSMIVGLSVSILSTLISSFIGIASGYFGGKFDMIMQRFIDGVMCLPGLLLVITILSLTGPGMLSVILVLTLRLGIIGSRIIRGAAMSVRGNMYIEAAVAIGCPTHRILTRHVLPNVMAPMIILATIRASGVILTEATLSFLGFGIPPTTPSWGSMLSGEGRSYMFVAPWMAIWPGLALAITVYGVNMFGDAVRDLLDPRLRGGVGRYGVRVKKEAYSKK